MWLEVVDAMGSGSGRSADRSGETSDRGQDGVQVRTDFEEAYDDLIDLVEWLALPYAGKSPIFALTDWQGNPLPANERLAATWEYVTGRTALPSDDTWVLCPTCGGQTVRTAIMEEHDA
jgi:endogenous inhibitor of DNA gyrase (YacG/DUF329 family)